MLLSGKTIVVTGGNSGIGEAIVVAAAEQGANVVIDYIAHPEETRALVAKIEAAGGRAVGVEADVTQARGLEAMVTAAVQNFGRLDALVNNAGMETRTSILDTTEEQYEKVLDVNLKSAFFGTQFAAKQFIAQGGGGIVLNISSVHEDWPIEPPRRVRRLHLLEGWGHGKVIGKLPGRAAGAGRVDGARGSGGLPLGVGGDTGGGQEVGDWVGGNAAEMVTPGRYRFGCAGGYDNPGIGGDTKVAGGKPRVTPGE